MKDSRFKIKTHEGLVADGTDSRPPEALRLLLQVRVHPRAGGSHIPMVRACELVPGGTKALTQRRRVRKGRKAKICSQRLVARGQAARAEGGLLKKPTLCACSLAGQLSRNYQAETLNAEGGFTGRMLNAWLFLFVTS
jgi:hypothetical protein